VTTAAAQTDLRALLALGQARRPWEFIRAVASAGPEVATIPPIRFLLAANLGSLGFADLAIEELDAVDASGTPGLNTADLRSGLASRTKTAVPVQSLRETAEHNLALLGLNRTCADTPPVWMTDTGACAWHDAGVITGCDADAHAASVLERSNLATDRIPSDHLPPLLIAGLSTPHLLRSALRATRPLANGYTPRIFVVEPDEHRATRALSILRLDEGLEGDPVGERLSLFTGEGAIESLGNALGSTIDCSLPRSVMLDPLAPKALAEGAQRTLTDLHERQRTAIDAEAARIERETQTLDEAVARVRAGTGLRVLIPVSRHSNFVRHSASDLAEALRSLGHIPTILTEPEPHRVLSRLGYLRAWADTNPDLVLTINHPRWRTATALPERAPSVCWVQDAMPHLFEDAASKQGEHDFIVGYRFQELTERFGYRPNRVIDAVLPVSTTKFHDGPVDADFRERFTCDVAFATRQSETPEAMRDRLRAESSASPAMGVVIDHLFETLRERIGTGAFSFTLKESHELARESLRHAGHAEPGHQAVDEVYRVVLMPLADRIVRHLVAHRTASICERRGWSFALYGSGWENHPTLTRHARGELLHGEELRAAYHCAGVHLHASAHSLIHQRSIECLFSGGRILSYRRRIDAGFIRRHTLGALLRTTEPDQIDSDGTCRYSVSDHPDLGRYVATLDRMRVNDPWRSADEIRVPADRIQTLRMVSTRPSESGVARLTHAVVDHCSFDDEDSLEASLEAILNRTGDADPSDHERLCRAAHENYAIDRVLARTLESMRYAITGSDE
jgi:hypothetical protein